MHVLVTGGAGYIGSHVAAYLQRQGCDIWVYDNLSVGHAAAAPPGRLIVGELHDVAHLAAVLRTRRIEAVMHFAALAQVGESVVEPARYYHNNVGGSLALLQAMRASGVRKVVVSSTTATYGSPAKIPIREDQLQQPVNPYGYSKLVMEQIFRDACRAHGLACTALRYFNAAGAAPDGSLGEDHAPETHLIPLVLQVALGQRAKITIFGDDYATPDGTCIRDYVHVEDLASAHFLALGRLAEGTFQAFNLGTGRGHSVREVIQACRRVSGRPIACDVGPRREGDPPQLVADASLAREVLSWRPQFVDLEAIVETAWRWHVRHPRGYADWQAAPRRRAA